MKGMQAMNSNGAHGSSYECHLVQRAWCMIGALSCFMKGKTKGVRNHDMSKHPTDTVSKLTITNTNYTLLLLNYK